MSQDATWKEVVAKKGLVKKDQGAIAADKNENKIERIKDNKTDTLIKQNSDSENNQAQNFIQSEHNKFQDNTNLNALLNTNQNGAEHKEENDDEDEGSILNQSYEDIFSIEKNKQKK